MTYDPNADRDYWRSEDTGRLIEAARDSGHELAIALGERLDQLAPDAERLEEVEYERDTLTREAEAHYDEYAAIDAALTVARDEIAELNRLLADAMGCAKP